MIITPTSPASSYIYSPAEKLRNFSVCLHQRLRPRKNLFVGPYAGEFGYELMQWQGFVRARKKHYDRVCVLTYPGRDYLYEDCEVHHHQIDLKKAGYWYGQLTPTEAISMAETKAAAIGLRDFDIFFTPLLCTQYHRKIFGPQEFRLLQEPSLTERPYDVAFHFRAVKKDGPDQFKNYSGELASELVERCNRAGFSVACIGHPDYSICPAGAADHRSLDLRGTVAAISSARTVAGENSGPMHLANLCGKPTILWAQDQWRIDYSLRWNPFRVPIYIAVNNSCQPEPKVVCKAIENSLSDLRVRTDDFSRPAYTLPAQRIADF